MAIKLVPYLAELLGTFVFLSAVLAEGTAVGVSVTLAAVIFIIGKLSGANVNPAISFMLWLKKDMTTFKFLGYVAAQIVGATLALLWWKNTLGAR